jgi:uncharacterized protein YfaQ (DUF2300 family)
VLAHPDPDVAGLLGARWRIKTWSWHEGDDARRRIGGFAGWLDGSPVWASARGTSRTVLARHARALAQLPLAPGAPSPDRDDDCVEVRLFARYPIERVTQRERIASPGTLRGDYRVAFRNGNTIGIGSSGELVLVAPEQHDAAPTLVARLSREDYVARVLEREAAAEPVEAARALAIVVRTYLQQNQRPGSNCATIDDSSATQRVLPRAPGAAARAIAAWTRDLVLAGATVRYHLDEPGPDRLAWSEAVSQAGSGARYDRILAQAFPRARLARWGQAVNDCGAVDGAAAWLRRQLPAWRPRLDAEIGYAETTDFEICRLASGRPHVDRLRRRLYVRALRSQQDRLDLTHEYLHLAFEAHPNGQDETYVEALARRLLQE